MADQERIVALTGRYPLGVRELRDGNVKVWPDGYRAHRDVEHRLHLIGIGDERITVDLTELVERDVQRAEMVCTKAH